MLWTIAYFAVAVVTLVGIAHWRGRTENMHTAGDPPDALVALAWPLSLSLIAINAVFVQLPKHVEAQARQLREKERAEVELARAIRKKYGLDEPMLGTTAATLEQIAAIEQELDEQERVHEPA